MALRAADESTRDPGPLRARDRGCRGVTRVDAEAYRSPVLAWIPAGCRDASDSLVRRDGRILPRQRRAPEEVVVRSRFDESVIEGLGSRRKMGEPQRPREKSPAEFGCSE